MIDLLKLKIRILENDLKLKAHHIEQLEYFKAHGSWIPDSLGPEGIREIAEQHQEKLMLVNLQIENAELKEENSLLKQQLGMN